MSKRYDKVTNSKVSLCQRDMTKLNIDVIVNSVNKTIIDGGCIDGAIHKAAGSGLVGKCQNLNGWETGESKITLATNCQLIICFILWGQEIKTVISRVIVIKVVYRIFLLII